MEIKGKVHCLFEQSGTFKNQFKELGYEAFDYDIQDHFPDSEARAVLFAKGRDEMSVPAGFTCGVGDMSVMPNGILKGRLPDSTDEMGLIKALKGLHAVGATDAVAYLIAWAVCRSILATMRGVSVCINGECSVKGGKLTWELKSLRLGTVKPISDSSAYKALGNGWTVDVVKHFYSFLPKEWSVA